MNIPLTQTSLGVLSHNMDMMASCLDEIRSRLGYGYVSEKSETEKALIELCTCGLTYWNMELNDKEGKSDESL